MLKSYCCFDCGNLNKSIKKINDNGHYNYGCNATDRNGHKTGFTIGDIQKDTELKMQGCSDWIPRYAQSDSFNGGQTYE